MSEREVWHGTSGGYSNHKCRCEECRLAWNRYCVERRNLKKERGDYKRHGRASTYGYGCRCALCRAAWAKKKRERMVVRAGDRDRPAPDSPCECCGEPAPMLVFDHDHTTGEFRGWLCYGCNTGIGKLGDSIEGLERALRYLRG